MADAAAPTAPEGPTAVPPPTVAADASPAPPTPPPPPETAAQGEDRAQPTSTSPVNTLKRPRNADPVTHFLAPSSANGSPAGVGEVEAAPPATGPGAPADSHGSAGAVPPKQVRVETAATGTPLTPRSPYANLPRKIPRKTPVSTPASSAATPPLVSPALRSPSALTTPPHISPNSAAAQQSKLAAMHQRWAGLLHGVLMKERQSTESEAVLALSLRIVQSLPGDVEHTKDAFQTLLVNMRDPKNGELRRKVVEGELLVERLVRMDDRELANPELRKQIEERMEDRAKDTNLSEINKSMRTSNSTLFKCKACGARDSSWYQRQTRSGDEPMTVIITCNRCNTQWRQY